MSIEKRIGHSIKMLHMDNGGEFLALGSYLCQHGMIHRRPCPYAHQQMGAVERKHRHVIDNSPALLNQASLPHSFWRFSFVVAMFTYSPYERPYSKPPNLRALKVSRCLVYLNLQPINRNICLSGIRME